MDRGYQVILRGWTELSISRSLTSISLSETTCRHGTSSGHLVLYRRPHLADIHNGPAKPFHPISA